MKYRIRYNIDSKKVYNIQEKKHYEHCKEFVYCFFIFNIYIILFNQKAKNKSAYKGKNY